MKYAPMTDAKQQPLVTLLTDFGVADAYVGIMRGVIHARCPGVRLADITHEIEQGNIHQGGYLLGTAWSYYPAGTVHCAVVDPGVGGDRRILAAEVDGHRFVAPDNGLLSDVFDQVKPTHVVNVESEDVMLKPVSHTFHGRDIFAPAAAALAAAAPLEKLGPATENWIHLPRLEPGASDGVLVGQVIHVDRFGNIITNLHAGDVPEVPRVRIAQHAIHGLQTSYGAVGEGKLLAIIGSTGRLEISANRAHAASLLGVEVGDAVRVDDES